MEADKHIEEQTKEHTVLSHKHIGRILRKLRHKSRLSQEDLAKITPFSQPTICRYEDKEVIEDEVLTHFAKAFGITLEELKNYEGDEEINIVIENNEFHDHSIGNNNDYRQTVYNYPVEKAVELYEKFIEVERKNSALLEERYAGLQQENQQLKQEIATLKQQIEELKKK